MPARAEESGQEGELNIQVGRTVRTKARGGTPGAAGGREGLNWRVLGSVLPGLRTGLRSLGLAPREQVGLEFWGRVGAQAGQAEVCEAGLELWSAGWRQRERACAGLGPGGAGPPWALWCSWASLERAWLVCVRDMCWMAWANSCPSLVPGLGQKGAESLGSLTLPWGT